MTGEVLLQKILFEVLLMLDIVSSALVTFLMVCSLQMQGFPQVLQTWRGGSSKFGGGGLKSKHGGSMGELKMLLKNICEGVHLIVKLPAISLQASKFTENELLHTHFLRILARF